MWRGAQIAANASAEHSGRAMQWQFGTLWNIETNLKVARFPRNQSCKEDDMARATAHPDHRCVSSNDVQGTEVYGVDGKHIGEVDHLIIDKMSGRVGYAVISFGGFMGLGHSHYPIPWSALTYDTKLGGFKTNITEQQLKDMPQFSDDSWQDRDWETRTHQYYRARPYWEATT
jgi:sporulation protein YlmC with PRC-barrel domain